MRRGRVPSELAGVYAVALEEYVEALAAAPLAQQTRRTYASKVRQYLAWLASADADGEPLSSAEGRDWAVRDYRTHLQAVLKRTPATVNNALAAVDDLYIRRGLGPAEAKRLEIPAAAPRALDQRAQIRYLRAVQASSSPRDRALALVPFCRFPHSSARMSALLCTPAGYTGQPPSLDALYRCLGYGATERVVATSWRRPLRARWMSGAAAAAARGGGRADPCTGVGDAVHSAADLRDGRAGSSTT